MHNKHEFLIEKKKTVGKSSMYVGSEWTLRRYDVNELKNRYA